MKKILLAAGLFALGLSASAQTVVGTDVIPVNREGLQSLIIERSTPTAAAIAAGVPAGSVTYRMFVDMQSDYQFLASSGKDNTTPYTYMLIESTLPFFNETENGTNSGASQNPGGWVSSPTLKYDSYAADGRLGANNIAVPYSVAPLGYVPRTTADPRAVPAGALNVPAYINIFEDAAATRFYDYNNGWIVAGAVGGPDAATNVVFIGQVTTPGVLSMDLTITLQNPAGAIAPPNFHIIYPEIPNVAPSVAIVTPVNGADFIKGDVVTLGAFATDTDGTVSSVEFFVNGVSVGIDNSSNGNTNPATPNYSVTWTALGTTAQVTAVAIDNDNAPTTSGVVNVTITDANPTLVAVTAPVAGSYNLSPITLTASASDANEPVQSVAFRVNGAVVGTDTDGSNGWSVLYTPVAALNVPVVAQATNSVGDVVSSTPAVIVSFANAAPTATIAPAGPFNLTVGNDTTFVVTAADADGSVSFVTFTLPDGSTSVDNSSPFSYTYVGGVPGNYSISARATDNLGLQSAATTATFTVVFAAGSGYAILPVQDYCSSSEVFCLPLVTTAAVTNVIGYDVEVLYDKSKVTPTGIVIPGEDLIANRDWTSYSYNVVNDSLIRISLFFDGDAPAGTVFAGQGTVFCVEFSRNYNFGDVDTAEFTIPLISESIGNGVRDITTAITGTYTTRQETQFAGSLSFWSDNSAIAYVSGTNLVTDIFGNVAGNNAATNSRPDANGRFTYNITNGRSIAILRDIANTTDVQSVINGYDAYLASKVSVEDPSFRPNVYQIIAMDVTRDGRVAAGDITQISQRAVSRLNSFSEDWVFVPATTVLNTPSYRISDVYPRPDVTSANGLGYSRNVVPVPSKVIALPINTTTSCITIGTENYKGIMVGDADGSYSSIPASPAQPLLKSTQEDMIIVDMAQNSVYASYSVAVKSIDLKFKGSFASDVKVSSTNGLTVTSNIVNDMLIISAQGDVKSLDLPLLTFSGSINVDEVPFSNLNGVNKIAVDMKSASSPTGVNTPNANVSMVYPNPVSNELFVSVDFEATVSIYNTAGMRLLVEENVNGLTAINVSELQKGLYIVEIAGKEKVERVNIIVE